MLAILKKYRSIFILTFFLLFNMAESLYFGQGTLKGYNNSPVSLAEWICDIISAIGAFTALVIAMYDTGTAKRGIVISFKQEQ